MRRASTISRYLLGLIFALIGANELFGFFPPPVVHASNLASQFHTALTESHYFAVVYALQLIAGVLLLVGRYVPLALTVLAAMLVNILLFNALLDSQSLPLAIPAALLWLLTAYGYRASFRPLLQSRAEPERSAADLSTLSTPA